MLVGMFLLVCGLAKQVENCAISSRAATRQQEKEGQTKRARGHFPRNAPGAALPTWWRGNPGGDHQVGAAKMARRRDHEHAE
eukprot:8835541-Pyramimonas_sp.AAC.1